MNYLGNAGSYLTETLLGLALFVVLLRFWMQWVRANFYNPIGQFLITATDPIVVPIRRIIPSIGVIDTATVVFALLIAVFKTYLLVSIYQGSIGITGLLMYSLGEVIKFSIYIFIAAIFIQIIASWINPHSYHPVIDIARAIAEPLMTPVQRLIPAVGGLDFSPIFVFIFLQLSLQLIVAPLQGG